MYMYVNLACLLKVSAWHVLVRSLKKGCQGCYWLPFASGHSPTLALSKDVVVYKDYSGGTCTCGVQGVTC